MKKDRDILSKSIFIILLLLLVLFSIYKINTFIKNFNYIISQKTVYVDINKINIPETQYIKDKAEYNNNELTLSSLQMPTLLSNYNYIFKAQEFPIEELNKNSIDSLKSLKETLIENLDNTISYSKDKNLILAQMQVNSKISNFENDAQNLLNSKIRENTPFKIQSFLENISTTQHTDMINTENNRFNSSVAFSKYLLYRNAYLNYFYLYELNVSAYRNQENKKIQEDINLKFDKFKKNNIDTINNNIIDSSDITKEIIKNIETHEKDKYFTFKQIYFKLNKINFDKNKIDYKKQDYIINNTNKETIIKNICKDNNYKVTFIKSTKDNIPDKTDFVQNILDTNYYLYEL